LRDGYTDSNEFIYLLINGLFNKLLISSGRAVSNAGSLINHELEKEYLGAGAA
jgi:hypothetical protein